MSTVGEFQRTSVADRPDLRGHSRAMACRFVERVLSARDATVLDEVLDPDAVGHASPLTTLLPLWLAFPDLRLRPVDVTSDGDVIAVGSVVSGTHTGPLLGVAPTGRRVTGRRTDRVRLVGRRVVEWWPDPDLGALAAQFGTPAAATRRTGPAGPACIGVARGAIVRRFVDEVLNARRFADGPGYFVGTPVDHVRGSLAGGLLLAGTPDYDLVIRDVRDDGGTVRVLADVRGGPHDLAVGLTVRVTRAGRFAETWLDPTVPAHAWTSGSGQRSLAAV